MKSNTSKLNNQTGGRAVMPVAIAENIIKATEYQIVLDPFAGSGTTGVAAQNTNRDFILMEQEPEYVEIIKQRLKDNAKELL